MSSLTRRHLLQRSALAGAGLALSACGGGGSSSNDPSQLRVLNLSTDVGAIDLYTGTDRRFSGATQGTLSDSVSLDPATYTIKLRKAGGDQDLLSSDRTLAKNEYYTAVVWGRESALQLTTLPENEDASAIASGSAKIRVYNASADLGAVDLYLTASATELGSTTALQTGVGNGSLSGYQTLNAGSYRLRITGSGDSGDLRLDLPNMTLGSQELWTVILTAGSSGVLAHATLVKQRGSAVAAPNTQARLRVVASAPGQGTTSVSWAGSSVVAALGSPTLSTYQLVSAGTQALQVRLGGRLIEDSTRTLSAGADHTLLVYGSGQAALISDDNRLPTSSARAKLRLVNAVGDSQTLTLTVDYGVVADGVAAGSGSTFASLTASSAARLDISELSTGNSLFTLEDAKLLASGVYTVFAVRNATGAAGLLRKDR